MNETNKEIELTGKRDEFEAWYGNINNCLERDGGYYIRGDVQNDWEVWQAARAAALEEAAPSASKEGNDE